MKKIISIFLALLMLVSSCGSFVAFGEYGLPIRCEDNYPVIQSEIEGAVYTPVFYLSRSVFDYRFVITLPDGSEVPLQSDGTENESKELPKYRCYGYAYVDFDEYEKVKEANSVAVPVHISVSLSEINKYGTGYDKATEYDMVVYKPLVENYIRSITPIENINAYAYENSETAFLNGTVFRVEYWDGSVKDLAAEVAGYDERYHYTLDGNNLAYDVNHSMNKIYVSYFDAACNYDLEEIREFPFSAIRFVGCRLNGDMPTEVIYEVTFKENNSVVKYAKQVNGYSGYLDMLEGFPVTYSTEGSKYTSTVEVQLGTLKDGKTYELQQQSLLQRIIAKIVWFFEQIFSSGIF